MRRRSRRRSATGCADRPSSPQPVHVVRYLQHRRAGQRPGYAWPGRQGLADAGPGVCASHVCDPASQGTSRPGQGPPRRSRLRRVSRVLSCVVSAAWAAFRAVCVAVWRADAVSTRGLESRYSASGRRQGRPRPRSSGLLTWCRGPRLHTRRQGKRPDNNLRPGLALRKADRVGAAGNHVRLRGQRRGRGTGGMLGL